MLAKCARSILPQVEKKIFKAVAPVLLDGGRQLHDPGSHNCAIFVCYINSSKLHLQSVALRSQYSDPTLEAVTLQKVEPIVIHKAISQ